MIRTATIPAGSPFGDPKKAGTLRVEGVLRRIGNQAPYFSITGEAYGGNRRDEWSGGCIREVILAFYPDLADFVALHLSDSDGAPMHAEANGFYWLAGALGGLGQEYHGGNSKGHHGGEYREPNRIECLDIFAKHCRISDTEAQDIATKVQLSETPRETWRAIMETMRPRWKQEAEAVIAKYNLK